MVVPVVNDRRRERNKQIGTAKELQLKVLRGLVRDLPKLDRIDTRLFNRKSAGCDAPPFCIECADPARNVAVTSFQQEVIDEADIDLAIRQIRREQGRAVNGIVACVTMVFTTRRLDILYQLHSKIEAFGASF